MDYLSTAQIAQKWGISANRVFKLIRAGRIPDAVKIGSMWMIPKDAEKPLDGRTKAGKAATIGAIENTEAPFRYLSSLEHRDPDSFNPPLTSEELQLKAAAEAFHACRFEEADELLADLPQRASSTYCKISALYTSCMINLMLGRIDRFMSHYGHLLEEAQGDYPHSKEMREFVHLLDSILGNDSYYARNFHVDFDYPYHESFLPRLAMLTTLSVGTAESSPTVVDLNVYEANCKLLEEKHAYDDLQTIHLYLGTAYAQAGRSEHARCHFSSALQLAREHELYFNITGHYYYWKHFYDSAFSLSDSAFRAHIELLSEDVHARYVRFMEKASLDAIHRLLFEGDYVLLHYAMQGYTSKEVAQALHISTSAANKRYSSLCASLGVKSKKELAGVYRKLTSESIIETADSAFE